MNKENNNKNSRHSGKRLPIFYIALCCCVLVIGAVGYISDNLSATRTGTVVNNVEASTPAPLKTSDTEIATLPPVSEQSVFNEEEPPRTLDELMPTEVPADDDITYDNPDIEAVIAPADISTDITLPVSGEILRPYSEEPSYDEVMQDWRTHNGIDISAVEGSDVRCAADGEVKSCISTSYGEEVVVTHSGGYETVYSCIQPNEEIAEGKNLRNGDVIGVISGNKISPDSQTHLHFEIKKDGKYIDPLSITEE
jgi:murein DD-endopeptidase MepM/ murein hydrolase activator NlpD